MEIRYLDDMKSVLYDQKWAKNAPNFELYYMHRGLKKKGELRYDITIIPSRMLGKEFVKTKGHYHIGKFQELYKVLEGQAIFLMQKGKNIVEDVCIIKAKKNEIVIIPSNYGHITINPSKKTLKMANWISKRCKSDYKPIEKMKGAGYFYTKTGWIKNKNYKKITKLRFEKPLKKIPKNLDFLEG
ncbi:glucose-6-phosphate isomerase [Candidatus Parcubacteria bacterium]|nr:glucose-6-phosphate isomerase [Candidatus Parcubacteria bacterium]